MKKNYSEITVVLDRSGSMESCAQDVIGGFNSFLEEQQAAPGEARISLFQFDDRYESVYEGRDVRDAPRLTGESFRPRGRTALFDAVGLTIASMDTRHAHLADEAKPEKVFFIIITDGQENCSVEYGFAQLTEMIRVRQDERGWQFVFLGASLEAVDTAVDIGIRKGGTMHYVHDKDGYEALYWSMSKNVSRMRDAKFKSADMGKHDFFDQEDIGKQEDIRKKKR